MNRLTKLTAGLALAALASGCLIVAHDGHVMPGDPLDAWMTVSWITESATTLRPVDCRSVGADHVRVVSDNLDTGDRFYDLFDCTLGTGSTAYLDAGDYDIRVDLVACGGSYGCASPAIFQSVYPVGMLSIFDNGRYDLGRVIFKVGPGPLAR